MCFIVAKGREWDVVFVKGFNEGVLPLPIRTNIEPEAIQRRNTDKENAKNTSNQGQSGTYRYVPYSSRAPRTTLEPQEKTP